MIEDINTHFFYETLVEKLRKADGVVLFVEVSDTYSYNYCKRIIDLFARRPAALVCNTGGIERAGGDQYSGSQQKVQEIQELARGSEWDIYMDKNQTDSILRRLQERLASRR